MLRCAIQLDHGQMPSLLVEADDHLKPLARFPGNECLGLSAGRTTWPALARFDSWFAIGGIAMMIDLTRVSCRRASYEGDTAVLIDGSAEDLGDLHFPERRAENLQPLYGSCDQLRAARSSRIAMRSVAG